MNALAAPVQVRVVWLLAASVLFGGGGGLVWWPASQQIAQLNAHAKESYDEANDLAAKVERAQALRAAQQRVRSDLRELSAGAATGQERLLRVLDDEARARGVSVRELAPVQAPANPQPTASPLAGLTGTDVTLTLRGPFRSIAAFLADVPRHDVLIDVRDAALQTTGSIDRAPILFATVHATIYRLSPTDSKEHLDVRALR